MGYFEHGRSQLLPCSRWGLLSTGKALPQPSPAPHRSTRASSSGGAPPAASGWPYRTGSRSPSPGTPRRPAAAPAAGSLRGHAALARPAARRVPSLPLPLRFPLLLPTPLLPSRSKSLRKAASFLPRELEPPFFLAGAMAELLRAGAFEPTAVPARQWRRGAG